MKLAACICIKILQLISTVATFIFKKLSDKYSERVLASNRKNLMEWTLLNTISLTKETDEFSILTILGFIFISAVLLITRIIVKDSNYHVCEVILLTCGLIFFSVLGLLIFGTVEELADSISIYAYALAGLSFICAALFGVDLLFFRQMKKSKNAISQTDLETPIETRQSTSSTQNINKNNFEKCCQPTTVNIGKNLKYLRTDL